MRANDARTATCALEICITWRDGTVLRHEHLCPPRAYVLRERSTHDEEAEFVVSGEWLSGREQELVSVVGERVTVHGPSGAVELRQGEQVSLTLGPLSFHVRLAEPLALGPGLRSAPVDAKRHVWTAASLAVHLVGLACMALMPPKASSLSLDALDADASYARYLITPVEQEALPWTADTAPDGAAQDRGEAARHADQEGEAGKPDARKTDNRMGIRGDDKQRIPPKVTAQNAGTQGILGVLSGAHAELGPSSPFGGATAVGYDPVAELGKLFGGTVGENAGFGGLSMRGTGRGGGGDAFGTIGVGRLNTGEGTIGAPGRGVLSSVRRESRVPKLRGGDSVVRGSLSKEAIRRVIQRNLAQVRFCYEQALSARPDLAGRVSVQFTIDPTGAVRQAVAAPNDLGHPALDRCITDAVRRWPFPAPEGGGYVVVSYPFVFEPHGE